MKRFLLLSSCLLTFWGGAFAQKYSNEFLSIGVGARGQAMGGAVLTGPSDVTAGYWNPAALPNIGLESALQVGAMHAEWFAGIGNFDYLGLAYPMDEKGRTIGLSLIRFGIDNIPNTLTLYEEDGTVNYDNIVEFSAADYAMLLSYAQPLKTSSGRLTLGGNIKIIHRSIGQFANSWGFGLDAALQYRTGDWSFGLVARDITTTFNAWTFSLTEEERETLEVTNNEIPINSTEITRPQIAIGAGWSKLWTHTSLTAEVNAVITTDGERNTLISSDPFSISPALGLEYGYKEFVFLRAGVNNFQDERNFEETNLTFQPNAGIGLKIKTFRIDYAFTDLGNVEDDQYSHVVSLQVDIKTR